MNHPADTRDTGSANLAFARALIAELQATGVATAIVCPGSRSTPLALAVAQQDGLDYAVHVDERSAAFHALGFAKAAGRPVVLISVAFGGVGFLVFGLAHSLAILFVARMIAGTGAAGFDAARKEYVDLYEAGIVDPTKVVRVALENAVSVASVLLLTEATMTEIPEKEKTALPEGAEI